VINVGELMSDPDFAQQITLRRPTLAVANEGEASYTYQERCLTAIVQPAKPSDVAQLPEGSRVGDIISVWSGGEISAGNGASVEADVLVVDGRHFRVIKAENWGRNGYFRALAEGFVP
jgi:hypothetical protein